MSLQTESASKKPKISKQKSSFDSAYCGDLQSITSKASTLDYMSVNDLSVKTSASCLKDSEVCYTGVPGWSGKRRVKDEKSRKLKAVEMPENLVPQMVEAFRPMIEECIRVNEVLPYLHFLGNFISLIFSH